MPGYDGPFALTLFLASGYNGSAMTNSIAKATTMTLTLDLAPDTQRRLAELAAKNGATLEAYAKEVLEREANGGHAPQSPAQENTLDLADFERSLDELAEGLPPFAALPADFCRADIYAEHA